MATPNKRTPDNLTRVCAELAHGVPLKFAAEVAGLGETTVHEYINPKHPRFSQEWSDAVAKARFTAVASRIKRIKAAGVAGNWQADAWYLERMHPEYFGRREVLQHEGEQVLTVRFVNDWRGDGGVGIVGGGGVVFGEAGAEASVAGGTAPMIEAAASGDDEQGAGH